MAVRKRGSGYQVDFMHKGVRVRETFLTESEAQEWEMLARASIIAGRPLPPVKNGKSPTGSGLHTLGPLFEHTCKTHWEGNPKIKAPEAMIQNADKVVKFYGKDCAVASITTEEMKRLVAHVVGEGYTYTTADRRLAALSKMLRLAEEAGVIPRVPRVPLSGEENTRIRFLTRQEADQLLKLWLEWDQYDLHVFTHYGLHTGARLQQLLDTRWSSFAGGYASVLLVGGDKKAAARTLPLPTTLREALARCRSAYPDQDGPFVHLKKDGRLRTNWDRMQAHTGWDDVVVHTLRHTCATWLLERTNNLKLVKDWLGHNRIETTLKYAKLVPNAFQSAVDFME